MSNKALNWVFDHSNTKESARVLMLAIADMSNDEGECYPGKAKLHEKVNVDIRNIRRLVRACEELGELGVIERDNPRRTNIYVITALAPASRLKECRAIKIEGGGAGAPTGGGAGAPTQITLSITPRPIARKPPKSVSDKHAVACYALNHTSNILKENI